MAKSIRSKSKLQAKSVKRKGEFAKYDNERSKRLEQKLVEHTKKQEEEKAAKKLLEGNDNESTMELDSKSSSTTDPKKHVPTSGWRDSRTQIYKQSKIKKGRKNRTMKY